MRLAVRLILPILVLSAARSFAQSAADAATLADLKIASKQMEIESEGTPAFKLEATYETFDFLGRPDAHGRWIEEFADPSHSRRTLRDSGSPENYAPEDQAAIGVTVPVSSTFMQRFIIDAALHPGPTGRMLEQSKLTYKSRKIGDVSLRCVIVEPQLPGKNTYIQRTLARAYCLDAAKPIIRFAQLAYGTLVTYNAVSEYGGKLYAKEVAAQQRGHERARLHVARIVAAPDLLTAALPERKPEYLANDSGNSGAIRVGSAVTAGQVLSKVTPVYPEDAKAKHESGQVVLHAVSARKAISSRWK